MDAWSCLDCYFTGSLRTDGSCERCGSQAVIHSERYGDKADQRQEVGQGIRRQVAILDYRAKEKIYQARERKAAQEAAISQGVTREMVGRG